ncbi:MAG TPA: hypothetical protein VHL09_17220, partial [Dehalococcoidia bacterium]|nr:hypothetical protein [Dehalococcoidia bacterium]
HQPALAHRPRRLVLLRRVARIEIDRLDDVRTLRQVSGVGFLSVAGDPADRNRVIAGTNGGGVLVSDDRGWTWTSAYPTRATVTRLVSRSDGVVFGLAGHLILRWDDPTADPRVIALAKEFGRPIAAAVAGREVLVGTTTGDLLLVDLAVSPFDRAPGAVSALWASPDEWCHGTVNGQVSCRPSPTAG